MITFKKSPHTHKHIQNVINWIVVRVCVCVDVCVACANYTQFRVYLYN